MTTSDVEGGRCRVEGCGETLRNEIGQLIHWHVRPAPSSVPEIKEEGEACGAEAGANHATDYELWTCELPRGHLGAHISFEIGGGEWTDATTRYESPAPRTNMHLQDEQERLLEAAEAAAQRLEDFAANIDAIGGTGGDDLRAASVPLRAALRAMKGNNRVDSVDASTPNYESDANADGSGKGGTGDEPPLAERYAIPRGGFLVLVPTSEGVDVLLGRKDNGELPVGDEFIVQVQAERVASFPLEGEVGARDQSPNEGEVLLWTPRGNRRPALQVSGGPVHIHELPEEVDRDFPLVIFKLDLAVATERALDRQLGDREHVAGIEQGQPAAHVADALADDDGEASHGNYSDESTVRGGL